MLLSRIDEYSSRISLYGGPVYTFDYLVRTQTTVTVYLKEQDYVPAPEGQGLTATPYLQHPFNSERIPIDENGKGVIRGLYSGWSGYICICGL